MNTAVTPKEIKGVLFDLDGLLLDTEPLYEKVLRSLSLPPLSFSLLFIW